MTKLGIGDKSPEFIQQTIWLQLTRDILGGTDAMRAAGRKYLPQRTAEDKASYEARLKGAVLLNQYDRTGGYLSGQVFQKPIRYQEPGEGEQRVPDEQAFWDSFYENADGQNTNLSVFANSIFRAGMDDGVSFILADYSSVPVVYGEDGGLYYENANGELAPKTEEADAANNWRPYLVLIKADQVLECRIETQNGVNSVTLFRYMETTEREVNGEWTEVVRVRKFTADSWELWEQQKGEQSFSQVDSGRLINERGEPLGRVPVVWFLPGKKATECTAQPAMKDLAWMNVSHWQAYADHVQLMQWVRGPVWFGVNLRSSDGEQVPFGANRLVAVDRDGATLQNVGIDSSSVDKSFEDLKAKESYMEMYGLQMLTATTSTMTATQADIAESASNSQLKEWVQKLSDTLENALALVARWKGYADGPAIWANTEFRIAFNANIVSLLVNMVNNDQLSKESLLETLKLMGVFADEFKVDEELARIAAAQAANQIYTPDFDGYADQDDSQQQQGS